MMDPVRKTNGPPISEAEREGWAGEAEGLKVSLAAATNKLAQIEMTATRRQETVSLGIPTIRDVVTATITAPPSGSAS
jgi:hypothetical protein